MIMLDEFPALGKKTIYELKGRIGGFQEAFTNFLFFV